MCLVMTVEPGLGGQKLIPETLEKVQKLKTYINENNINIDIEVDGGIKPENIEEAKKAGANIFVVGTAIVNSDNMEETIENLKNRNIKTEELLLKEEQTSYMVKDSISFENEYNEYIENALDEADKVADSENVRYYTQEEVFNKLRRELDEE